MMLVSFIMPIKRIFSQLDCAREATVTQKLNEFLFIVSVFHHHLFLWQLFLKFEVMMGIHDIATLSVLFMTFNGISAVQGQFLP